MQLETKAGLQHGHGPLDMEGVQDALDSKIDRESVTVQLQQARVLLSIADATTGTCIFLTCTLVGLSLQLRGVFDEKLKTIYRPKIIDVEGLQVVPVYASISTSLGIRCHSYHSECSWDW
jgi:hypothetical protein